MNAADFVILGTIIVSMGLSLYRGFAIEALSLATWVASFIIARLFSLPLAVLLADWLDPPSVRQPIAFIVLVIMTLIVGTLIKQLVKKMVEATGLSGLDRTLGSAFGLFRGCLLVVIALSVLANMTEMPQDPWWNNSNLIPHFMMVEEWTAEMGQHLWEKLMSVGAG